MQNTSQMRSEANALFKEGNYKSALELFKKLAVSENLDQKEATKDFSSAVSCLERLGKIDEFDAFAEEVAEKRKSSWRMLKTIADSYRKVLHDGYILEGLFYRGYNKSGGKYVSAFKRDHIRSFQLYLAAIEHIPENESPEDKFDLFMNFAGALKTFATYQEDGSYWKFQYLTDLSKLPDYEENNYQMRWGWRMFSDFTGAPVDNDGNPIFYQIPASFETAKNDGERWRFLLETAKKASPQQAGAVDLTFADFLNDQFGVQTIADSPVFQLNKDSYGYSSDDNYFSAIKLLSQLSDDETIAKLANGIKRFTLPDEFNPIKIYQKVSEGEDKFAESALSELAEIFTNRKQFSRAADCWRQSISRFGDSNKYKEGKLKDIVGNWGAFEPSIPQPSSKKTALPFKFRNAKKVSLKAEEINVPLFLEDIKKYLESNPEQIDYERIRIEDIGWRLVNKNLSKYLKKTTIKWDLELAPIENHFDKEILIETPLTKPGAYLVTANVENGNTTRIILWIADTAIVSKPSYEGKQIYYVADANTGKPLPKIKLDFFAYRVKYNDYKTSTRRTDIIVCRHEAQSDQEGLYVLDSRKITNTTDSFDWLCTVNTSEGRFAYLGFNDIWFTPAKVKKEKFEKELAYFITDRPVYRPKNNVHLKCWVRKVSHTETSNAKFANSKFLLEVRDPSGEKVIETQVETDRYGAFEFSWQLQKNARLGRYNISLSESHGQYIGGAYFRVEEYKKPEFEVKVVTPEKPVKLGDIIPVKISANYYFGAPVTNAKVKYKIERTEENLEWFPPRPWDWLYGNGYWWHHLRYSWLLESLDMPLIIPPPYRQKQPPELVCANEVDIGENGEVEIKIDSSIAKELFGNKNQKYQITAEVTDLSRRTIVGKGAIIAAIKPLIITVWTDKGFYELGNVITANFAVQTADGKPFPCKATVKLQKLLFNETLNPDEETILTHEVTIGENGFGELKFSASAPGQFKLLCETTTENIVCKGAIVFNVRDRNNEKNTSNANNFRYNKLELISEKPEYTVGEKARIMINCAKENPTILLFLRPVSGLYSKPLCVNLNGNSTIYEFDITNEDIPNIFVEAITIYDALVFIEKLQITVPPEKKALNVEIQPSKQTFAPDERATTKIKITELNGNPVSGNVVVTIYDKALEYISSGSNIPPIKEYFWGWKRFHEQNTQCSLFKLSRRIIKDGEKDMPEFLFSRKYFGMSYAMAGMVKDRFKGEAKLEMVSDALMPLAAKAEINEEGGGYVEVNNQIANVPVRSLFADTALWIASLNTDSQGETEISLTMPQNLTTWKVKAWSLTEQNQVGEGETEIITSKNFIVRLQSPRFFTEGDTTTISANIHNYLNEEINAVAVLELSGKSLELYSDSSQKNVVVPAGGEKRVDWKVKAVQEGETKITVKAVSSVASDGMQMSFPVKVHGSEKMLAKCGMIPDGQLSAKFAVSLSEKIKIRETRYELRYSPTLAGAMLSALPFLLNYPYGCTEQTLNRFLPAIITRNTLAELGVNLAELKNKISNLNPQELGEDEERIRQHGIAEAKLSPVFDEEKLNDIISDSLARLEFMQNSDGGWGWFSGYGEYSDPHTTALIVHGLKICQKLKIPKLNEKSLKRGINWLKNYRDCEIRKLKNAEKQKEPWKTRADDIDALVNCVLAENEIFSREIKNFLLRDKTELSLYGLTLLGLALEKEKDAENLTRVMKNLEQYVEKDDENQTAWIKLPRNSYWWLWTGSGIETMAHYLKLLVASDPKNELCPKLVKYLLNNRRHGSYWDSTRDTAFCIEAFAEHLKASGETKPDMDIEIYVNDKLQKTVHVDSENLFTFDNSFVLTGANFSPGEHQIKIVRKGSGPLYYNSYLNFFTLEDFISKAGLEIKIDRNFYLLKRIDDKAQAQGKHGSALLINKEKYERIKVASDTILKSGDLIEIELIIESKNDYEHIIVEDMKAGGFEPCEVRSGYDGNKLGAYVEYRDDRVCFFVRSLPHGKHAVSYRMRAEIPGSYSALPTKAWGMYAPELKANSDEFKPSIH